MIKTRIVILVFFLVFFGAQAYSQTSKSDELVKVNGEKFYIHHVVKGQTLYAISKLYSITVADIEKANPGVEASGIKIDQTLFIPDKKIDKKEAKKSELTLEGDTIYHKVLKQETLYALSKKYDMSVVDIEKYNPEVKDGLKIDMVLAIPLKKKEVALEKKEIYNPATPDSLRLHELKPKETLVTLSKQYNVSVDSIQLVNDGLQTGLREGATVRIPLPNPDFIVEDTLEEVDLMEVGSARFDSISILKIGVFLPFYLKKNRELIDSNSIEMGTRNEMPEVYNLSKFALDFYHGVVIALDSLAVLGYNLEVHYFDTENDTGAVKRIISENDWSSYNLFIGPLYKNNFRIVATMATKNNIPIVSPVKISSKVLLGNPYIFKAYSSSPARVIDMASFMAKQYADSSLFLINSGLYKDKRSVALFKKYADRVMAAKGDTIREVTVDKPYVIKIPSFVPVDSNAFIGAPANDQAYVSQLLSRLYDLSLSDDFKGKITVFGSENWLKYSSIDLKFFVGLNVHVPTQQYIDYSAPDVRVFIRNYRLTYATDPSAFVFRGFDVTMYFVQSIVAGKSAWDTYIENHPGEGLSLKFDFIKVGVESGYENQGGYILKYQDFKLVLAR